jgi:cytoskeletal protein RodZ
MGAAPQRRGQQQQGWSGTAAAGPAGNGQIFRSVPQNLQRRRQPIVGQTISNSESQAQLSAGTPLAGDAPTTAAQYYAQQQAQNMLPWQQQGNAALALQQQQAAAATTAATTATATTATSTGPLGIDWTTWMLLGGGALLLVVMMGRHR